MYRAWLDRSLAAARQQLDQAKAAAAHAEGVAMPAALAIADATAYLDAPADSAC